MASADQPNSVDKSVHVIDSSMEEDVESLGGPATQPPSQAPTDGLDSSIPEILDLGIDYGDKLRQCGIDSHQAQPYPLLDEGAESVRPESIDTDTFVIAHITIDSSDTVKLESTRETGCRFLRDNEKHLRSLLRVTFQTSVSFKRMHQMLLQGIELDRKGTKYEYQFMAFSASMLRGRRCWFIRREAAALSPSPADILSKAGDFRDLMPSGAGKLSARIGQLFSKSKYIRQVPLTMIRVEEDFIIDTPDGKTYCSSDGCGRISLHQMAYVAYKLGLISITQWESDDGNGKYHMSLLASGKIPTAIQVRLAGAKGMLVVDSELGVGQYTGIHYMLRPSMIKFADVARGAETVVLDVCDWSGPASVGKLNVQLINILEYRLKLAEKHDDCNPILNAVKGAVKQWEPLVEVVRNIARSVDVNQQITIYSSLWKTSSVAPLIYAGFDIKDPYILNQLAALCSSDLTKLNEKYNVPLRESRRAFGVVDTTHILQPGEIFFQFNGEGNAEITTIEGRVAVYRNPCYHPGDLRVLTAVDHPELRRRYLNVVVFPSMMKKKETGTLEQCGVRPHTDEMAGGDLDGDSYMVIFAHSLVPKTEVPAAVYGEFKPKMAADVTICKKWAKSLPQEAMSQMIHFFVYYAAKLDKIGIANAKHTKYCETVGIDDPDALRLAVLVSKAMDAAKTGEELTTDELNLLQREPQPRQTGTKPLKAKLEQAVADIRAAAQIIVPEANYEMDPAFRLPEALAMRLKKLTRDGNVEKFLKDHNYPEWEKLREFKSWMMSSCNSYASAMSRIRREGAEERNSKAHRNEFRRNSDGVYVLSHSHEAPELKEKVLREFWEHQRHSSWEHKLLFVKIIYWYVYAGECQKEHLHLRYEWVWLFRDYLLLLKKGLAPTQHPHNHADRWQFPGVWVDDAFLPAVFKTRFGRPPPQPAQAHAASLSSSGSHDLSRSSSNSSSASDLDAFLPAAKRQKLNDANDHTGGL